MVKKFHDLVLWSRKEYQEVPMGSEGSLKQGKGIGRILFDLYVDDYE